MNKSINDLLEKRSKLDRALAKLTMRQISGSYGYIADNEFLELSREFGFRSTRLEILVPSIENLIEDIDNELNLLGYKVPFWKKPTYRDRDD